MNRIQLKSNPLVQSYFIPSTIFKMSLDSPSFRYNSDTIHFTVTLIPLTIVSVNLLCMYPSSSRRFRCWGSWMCGMSCWSSIKPWKLWLPFSTFVGCQIRAVNIAYIVRLVDDFYRGTLHGALRFVYDDFVVVLISCHIWAEVSSTQNKKYVGLFSFTKFMVVISCLNYLLLKMNDCIFIWFFLKSCTSFSLRKLQHLYVT